MFNAKDFLAELNLPKNTDLCIVGTSKANTILGAKGDDVILGKGGRVQAGVGWAWKGKEEEERRDE